MCVFLNNEKINSMQSNFNKEIFGIKQKKNVTKSTKLEFNVLWFGHEHQNYN